MITCADEFPVKICRWTLQRVRRHCSFPAGRCGFRSLFAAPADREPDEEKHTRGCLACNPCQHSTQHSELTTCLQPTNATKFRVHEIISFEQVRHVVSSHCNHATCEKAVKGNLYICSHSVQHKSSVQHNVLCTFKSVCTCQFHITCVIHIVAPKLHKQQPSCRQARAHC